jgi:hypothetical protein
MGSTRYNVCAETPLAGTVINHTASNYTVNGVRVSAKTVPDVTETRR